MESVLQVIFSAVFVSTILRVSTPLILPALGGLIAELGGVPNIALEGMMLTAACAGVLVSAYTQSEWLGLLAGVLLAEIMALILGFFHLKEDLRRNIEFGDSRSNQVRTTVNTIESTKDFEQGELPLQNVSKGIFLNTTPVNHNGEDLDVPTYQRKMIIIDKGA